MEGAEESRQTGKAMGPQTGASCGAGQGHPLLPHRSAWFNPVNDKGGWDGLPIPELPAVWQNPGRFSESANRGQSFTLHLTRSLDWVQI